MEEEKKRDTPEALPPEVCEAQEGEMPVIGEQEPAPSVPMPDWQFGEDTPMPEIKKEKRPMGSKGFFITFGAVFGVCLALLLVVLFVGDEGFQIIRNLRTERVVYTEHGDTPLSPSEAADIIAKSTVTISVRTAKGTGLGSGFVYSADGYIVTNHHVISEATEIQVILPSGEAYDAVPEGYDALADLAVLKVEATGLTPVQLGSSAELLVGEQVVAVGTPGKLDYAGTATFGRISATERLISMYSGTTVKSKLTVIQTDTPVNPGNSGGPLADMNGRVVGVVVMKISTLSGTTFEGVGFALPIDGVKTIVDEIIEKGEFSGRNPIAEGRSLLGVTGHTAKGGLWYANTADPETGAIPSYPNEQPDSHYISHDGVYVTEVNGGNAIGKMAEGDLILAVNGLRVRSIEDLIAAANRHYVGETVTVTVFRSGSEIDVDIILYEG